MEKAWLKIVSLVLVISTLLTALPMAAFAEGAETEEIYIKSVRLAQAKTKDKAKTLLESEGYIFLDGNLNEGTGEDGIWMGYTTTTDPEEAIYDMKLMNMNGGFTLTSMEAALAAPPRTLSRCPSWMSSRPSSSRSSARAPATC